LDDKQDSFESFVAVLVGRGRTNDTDIRMRVEWYGADELAPIDSDLIRVCARVELPFALLSEILCKVLLREQSER